MEWFLEGAEVELELDAEATQPNAAPTAVAA
jgi:hypothetical protein